MFKWGSTQSKVTWILSQLATSPFIMQDAVVGYCNCIMCCKLLWDFEIVWLHFYIAAVFSLGGVDSVIYILIYTFLFFFFWYLTKADLTGWVFLCRILEQCCPHKSKFRRVYRGKLNTENFRHVLYKYLTLCNLHLICLIGVYKIILTFIFYLIAVYQTIVDFKVYVYPINFAQTILYQDLFQVTINPTIQKQGLLRLQV